jgi:hypothetical protein
MRAMSEGEGDGNNGGRPKSTSTSTSTGVSVRRFPIHGQVSDNEDTETDIAPMFSFVSSSSYRLKNSFRSNLSTSFSSIAASSNVDDENKNIHIDRAKPFPPFYSNSSAKFATPIKYSRNGTAASTATKSSERMNAYRVLYKTMKSAKTSNNMISSNLLSDVPDSVNKRNIKAYHYEPGRSLTIEEINTSDSQSLKSINQNSKIESTELTSNSELLRSVDLSNRGSVVRSRLPNNTQESNVAQYNRPEMAGSKYFFSNESYHDKLSALRKTINRSVDEIQGVLSIKENDREDYFSGDDLYSIDESENSFNENNSNMQYHKINTKKLQRMSVTMKEKISQFEPDLRNSITSKFSESIDSVNSVSSSKGKSSPVSPAMANMISMYETPSSPGRFSSDNSYRDDGCSIDRVSIPFPIQSSPSIKQRKNRSKQSFGKRDFGSSSRYITSNYSGREFNVGKSTSDDYGSGAYASSNNSLGNSISMARIPEGDYDGEDDLSLNLPNLQRNSSKSVFKLIAE